MFSGQTGLGSVSCGLLRRHVVPTYLQIVGIRTPRLDLEHHHWVQTCVAAFVFEREAKPLDDHVRNFVLVIAHFAWIEASVQCAGHHVGELDERTILRRRGQNLVQRNSLAMRTMTFFGASSGDPVARRSAISIGPSILMAGQVDAANARSDVLA